MSEVREVSNCARCGKKLRDFKTRRDWEVRALHLSCWKEERDEMAVKLMMEDMLKRQTAS